MAKYKRSTYLINPKFQLRFGLFFCGLIFLSSLIYPLTIYDLLTSFIEFTSKTNPGVTAQLEEKRSSLIVILSLWQLGFMALVFVISIFFSHKIAGPMYKLQKFLREKTAGVNHDKLYFRKGDYFTEIADELNSLFDQRDQDQMDDLVYLDEVKSYLGNLGMVVPEDKQAVLHQIVDRLDLIQERYKK